MYTKKKQAEIVRDHDTDLDGRILIEDHTIAVHFSGRDVFCIPVERDRTSKRKDCRITKYRVDKGFVSDRWEIYQEAIFCDEQEVVIAVSLSQMLFLTAPDWSKKALNKYFKEVLNDPTKE